MKKLIYIMSGLMALSLMLVSCTDEETYADQKEREAKQISKWLADNKIDVISMADFLKDTITNNPVTGPDSTLNQYVLFSDNGVYMQIIRRGEGRLMKSGEIWDLNARYTEQFVRNGDYMSLNTYEREPDIFYVQRTGDNYTGSFRSGVMPNRYGNSVPNSWLMLMPFIKPGLLNADGAKVRLIVPHNQGTQLAASNVYPAFYEITITTRNK